VLARQPGDLKRYSAQTRPTMMASGCEIDAALKELEHRLSDSIFCFGNGIFSQMVRGNSGAHLEKRPSKTQFVMLREWPFK